MSSSNGKPNRFTYAFSVTLALAGSHLAARGKLRELRASHMVRRCAGHTRNNIARDTLLRNSGIFAGDGRKVIFYDLTQKPRAKF